MTAVEWFNQQLIDRQNGNGYGLSWDEIFEQAKQLEADEKVKFAIDVFNNRNENESIFVAAERTLNSK